MSKITGQTRRASSCARTLLLAVAAVTAIPSHAALGGNKNAASALVAPRFNGTVYEYSYTDAGGTTIHEYSNTNGQIFAYAWSGPTAPDLHELLGSRFTAYGSAAAQGGAGMSLHSGHVAFDDVVVNAGGAMRAYAGSAWLPALMPAGVAVTDLK